MNSFLQGESCSQKESKSCGLLRQHIPPESHFSLILLKSILSYHRNISNFARKKVLKWYQNAWNLAIIVSRQNCNLMQNNLRSNTCHKIDFNTILEN